jgi:hypothetical protein
MNAQAYLETVRFEFSRLKSSAEKGLAQIQDKPFFTGDELNNSPAILVKHVGGNLKSRWTDFLTTDGEKPDRHRDTEFEILKDDSRESLMALWGTGWKAVLDTLDALTPDDLDRTVTIRGEAHSVIQAVNRSLTHIAYHVGQLVYLCKNLAGENWQTMSIPRGQSADAAKNGKRYFNHYGR